LFGELALGLLLIVLSKTGVGAHAGQLGLADEFSSNQAPVPPPPPMKISEVIKEQTFEHHVAARLKTHHPAAPAPGPSTGTQHLRAV
jgi:hypothetical protein